MSRAERMRVTQASYRGRDGKDQPFQLNAASAVQQSSRDPIVRLQSLNAAIRVTDGPATLRAERGRYDMNSERMAIDGPVIFDGSGGYHIETRDVLLDLKRRDMASLGAVDGKMPLGTFAANTLRADLDKRIVTLAGRARLHISFRAAPQPGDDPPRRRRAAPAARHAAFRAGPFRAERA